MRPSLFVFPALFASAVALASCAKGSQFEALTGGADGGGGDRETGDGGGGASDTGGGDAGGGGGGTGGATGTTTTTDTGGTGGGGTGGGGMGGSPCDFSAPDICSTAEQLPDVSADEGGLASAAGTGDKWFKVHLKETDSSIFASDLGYLVTLTSPPGMDYDLFVKQGPEDGSPDCGATAVQGSPAGSSESVSSSWNDDQGLGGEDDSRWINIEIVHVSGDDCDAKWTLTVVGNP